MFRNLVKILYFTFGALFALIIEFFLLKYRLIQFDFKVNVLTIISVIINIIIVIFISVIFQKYFSVRKNEKDIILDSIKELRINFTNLKNITIKMLSIVRKFNEGELFSPEDAFNNSIGNSYLNIERLCIDNSLIISTLIEKSSFPKKIRNLLNDKYNQLNIYIKDHLKLNQDIRDLPENNELSKHLDLIIQSYWEFNLVISELIIEVNKI